MKLSHLKFSVITLLSVFLIVFPALSQSASYTATINRFRGVQVGQTIRANTPNNLADSIYAVIRPSGNPLPKISISLSTDSLSTLQKTIRSKGVSAQYFEFGQGNIWTGKSPWNLVNVSSIQSTSATYGVSFAKSGYMSSQPIPFRVTRMQNGSPRIRFDRSSETLVDSISIGYTVDAGNSGIKINWFEQYLRKDSRLRLFPIETNECMNQSPNSQSGCPLHYSIRLSRG